MAEFFQQLINGLALGSIYALIALGYTMVYGVLRLINFAHGDVYMVGAMVGFYTLPLLKKYLHLDIQNSYLKLTAILIAAMLVCGLLGAVIERLAYRPLRNAPRLNALITAIGVSLFLEYFGQYLFGADPKSFPQLVENKEVVNAGGVVVNNIQLIIFCTSFLLMFALNAIVMKTRAGKAMRAVSFSHTAGHLVGINVNYVIRWTFIVGSMLAAVAGILVGLSNPRIDPLMGMMPGLKAFVAAVLGGIGSIPGALIGGLFLGIAETLVAGYISSTYRNALAFVLLIAVLLIRPTGIFRENFPGKSMKRLLWIALTLLALLGLNWIVGRYLNAYALLILNLVGINLIMSASLNLINGYTGQFNLGHAGFMAVGAYSSAAFSVFTAPVLQAYLDFLPSSFLQPALFLAALFIGGCAAGLSGLAIGMPTLRLRGDYLAIATLGFGEIVQVVITNMDSVGGARGFTDIPEFGNFFWIFSFATLTLWIVHSMTRSAKGLSFLAIREDEIASVSLGISSTQVKVKAFVIGAFLAGIGGGLFAHLLFYLNVNQFSFLYSIGFVVMVVLGGLGNLWGVALATVLLTLLPELLRPFAKWRMVIYSLLIILTMLLRSKGFSLKGAFRKLRPET